MRCAVPVPITASVFLTLGGFIVGIIFWSGFNTALEATNTEEFCTGCHEMESNVFAELQTTIHCNNRPGVRAECPDCHVPHKWTDKIARKMQASKGGANARGISRQRRAYLHRLP
jgi:cytochrome c-type protein NapC